MANRRLRTLPALAVALLFLTARPLLAQAPPATGEAALADFMRAVTDSNLSRMAALWGTQKGSAAKTKAPPDFERRLLVMHAFLKGNTYRLAASEPEEAEGRRSFLVEFNRSGCAKVAQVRTVRTKNEGWLVNFIDLSAVSAPGKPCEGRQVQQDSTSAGS